MIPSKMEMYNALAERHGKIFQKKVSSASVAVCGIGGLGSNIAISLARAGVKNIHIIDFDKVDISNLNRQQYFLEQLGMYKTDALKETLSHIAPYCEITADCVKLNEINIPELLKHEDIICEAFDNAETKAMFVNCVLENMPDKYLVSGSGMAGIDSANVIQTRKITEKFYLCGDEYSDIADGMGLFSSRVMVCAGHQAHTILRIIAGKYEA